MDPQEIRDKIMAAINGVIKGDQEQADSNIHDVLAAKMRDRINPPRQETPGDGDPDGQGVDLDPPGDGTE